MTSPVDVDPDRTYQDIYARLVDLCERRSRALRGRAPVRDGGLHHADRGRPAPTPQLADLYYGPVRDVLAPGTPAAHRPDHHQLRPADRPGAHPRRRLHRGALQEPGELRPPPGTGRPQALHHLSATHSPSTRMPPMWCSPAATRQSKRCATASTTCPAAAGDQPAERPHRHGGLARRAPGAAPRADPRHPARSRSPGCAALPAAARTRRGQPPPPHPTAGAASPETCCSAPPSSPAPTTSPGPTSPRPAGTSSATPPQPSRRSWSSTTPSPPPALLPAGARADPDDPAARRRARGQAGALVRHRPHRRPGHLRCQTRPRRRRGPPVTLVREAAGLRHRATHPHRRAARPRQPSCDPARTSAPASPRPAPWRPARSGSRTTFADWADDAAQPELADQFRSRMAAWRALHVSTTRLAEVEKRRSPLLLAQQSEMVIGLRSPFPTRLSDRELHDLNHATHELTVTLGRTLRHEALDTRNIVALDTKDVGLPKAAAHDQHRMGLHRSLPAPGRPPRAPRTTRTGRPRPRARAAPHARSRRPSSANHPRFARCRHRSPAARSPQERHPCPGRRPSL